ncbi:MAG TPA: sugar ABC transporter ATP-binding protein [Bacteroidota bacterium]|nr:sugar ABC transporter ATP-binding protein [Bacteroidota bacterium]
MLPLLEMRSIKKTYPGVLALDSVDFDVLPGEVHCLLGENGAGKSTLMKILAGALAADSGSILIEGREVDIDSPTAAQALGIGMIYQDFKLVPELTAAENIMLGHEPRSFGGLFLDRTATDAAALAVLAELGEEVPMNAPVRTLSLAERQVVEIGKAMSRTLKILALDEPTASLTSPERANLFEAVRKLKALGVGVIYITHRLEEIFEIGDRITVLRDGHNVDSSSVNDATGATLIRSMVGRELSGEYPRNRRGGGETLLRLENISGGAITGVDLEVRAGEVLGLGGLAGAGRTELARIIFGTDPIEGGRMIFRGAEIRPGSPREAIDLGIGYLSEDRNRDGLVLEMSVRENITLPSLPKVTRGWFIDKKTEGEACGGLIKQLTIKTPDMNRRVEELSGGNRQKVVLARWLMTNSRLLIFDEPTAGIDVGVKFEIHSLIDSLAAGGMGVLVISSDMPELLGVSDRVAVMSGGTVTGVLARGEATQERIMELAMKKVGKGSSR